MIKKSKSLLFITEIKQSSIAKNTKLILLTYQIAESFLSYKRNQILKNKMVASQKP